LYHGEFAAIRGVRCPLGYFKMCPCGERADAEFDALELDYHDDKMDLDDENLTRFLVEQGCSELSTASQEAAYRRHPR
jgi:hypothetical protein